MTQAQKSNLSFVMKEAHKLCKEIIEPGHDYHVMLGQCMKIVYRMMTKKLPKKKKAFGSAVITQAQKETIAKMRNVLGSKWDGTRGTRINNISKQQAAIEINRNMDLYLQEKELGFCPVDMWQKIIIYYEKNGQKLTKNRRDVSELKAREYLKKIGA
jgi:hypothetical protein